MRFCQNFGFGNKMHYRQQEKKRWSKRNKKTKSVVQSWFHECVEWVILKWHIQFWMKHGQAGRLPLKLEKMREHVHLSQSCIQSIGTGWMRWSWVTIIASVHPGIAYLVRLFCLHGIHSNYWSKTYGSSNFYCERHCVFSCLTHYVFRSNQFNMVRSVHVMLTHMTMTQRPTGQKWSQACHQAAIN